MSQAALASQIASPAESVITDAIAQIMSAGAASRSLSARIAADSRMIWLTAEYTALTAHYADGMLGAAMVVIERTSARAARRARIDALLVARENQLRKNRKAVRLWMAYAFAARTAEVLRKASHGADAALARLDRVLEAV